VKKLLVAIVLVAVAILAYRHFGGGSYGIGPGHPLGRLSALDSHLTRMGLEKQPAREITPDGFDVTFQVHEYADVETSKLTGIHEGVKLFVNEAGRVCCVNAQFRFYGDNPNPFEYTNIPRFIIAYWHDVGGGTARFEPAGGGRNIFARRYEIATFANDRIEGKWIKEAPVERIQITTRD